MEYLIANISDLADIITLKNEVKNRIISENLAVWLGDYPQDNLLKDEIKKGRGRVIKIDNQIVAYASLHKASIEYYDNTFCHNDLYSFSRLMTSSNHLNQGIAYYLINSMLEEVKNKCYGFGLIVDECNTKAIKLYEKLGFKKEGYSKQVYGNFINYTYYYNPSYTDNINYELAQLASFNKYEFDTKLYKTKYKILGIKIPDLRVYVKKLDICDFYKLEFRCIEDLMLASLMLKKYKDHDLCVRINHILEYCDSWAITDLIASTIKQIKDKEEYLGYINTLLTSKKEFFVRCGVVILLSQFKNVKFYDTIYKLISNIDINTYYVNMAIAWLLCEMSFNDIRVFDYIKSLNEDINKMFIQKRKDSLRGKKK